MTKCLRCGAGSEWIEGEARPPKLEKRPVWRTMREAPKDGTAVLVLLDGSDIPHGVRWLSGKDDAHATEATEGPGWYVTWDGVPVGKHDGPRYWMHCPDDPDA